MARPRTFDETTALDAAMNLFWERGYDGTGLADLLDAMEIQRGSLYKAWGSKAGLFRAVLDRYDVLHVAPGVSLLENDAIPGPERIVRLFQVSDPRGCLLCSTAAGVAGTDPDVAAWIKDRLDRLRAAFAVALRDDDNAENDVVTAADRLMREYIGTRVNQRVNGYDEEYSVTV